jgi:hypothetical protein
MFSNWDIKTLYDVIARIPGSTEPEEWVIRGNHHDAWVNGADDPISGMSAELEEARSLGELVKQGWRPRRTIVYCAWEPGLLGSTEWVETHLQDLKQHAVMYLKQRFDGARVPVHRWFARVGALYQRRGERCDGSREGHFATGSDTEARDLPCARQ